MSYRDQMAFYITTATDNSNTFTHIILTRYKPEKNKSLHM